MPQDDGPLRWRDVSARARAGRRRYPLLSRIPWPLHARPGELPPVPVSRLESALAPPGHVPTDEQPPSPSGPPPPAADSDAPAVDPEHRPEPASRAPVSLVKTRAPQPVSLVRQPRAEPVSLVRQPRVAPVSLVRQPRVAPVSLVKTPTPEPVSLVRQPPPVVPVSLVKTPAGTPREAGRDQEAYDEFWAQTVHRERFAEPTRRPARRGVAVVAVAALWLVAAAASVAVVVNTRSADSEVMGQRFIDPPDPPVASAAPDPQEASETADVDDAGVVSLTQTLVWSDAVPAVIDLQPPDLAGVSGLPGDMTPVIGQPVATLDDQPLVVSAQDVGGWRVTTPGSESPGSVVVSYVVTDAVHRDESAPPGRALVAIPLPPTSATADVPRQLTLPADKVLNVSCPVPASETVVLCGTLNGETWLVTVPPGGNVVLAQMDLPGL